MCDKSMVSDDLIETRRAIYAQPGFTDTMKRIMCLQEMEIRRPNMITRRAVPVDQGSDNGRVDVARPDRDAGRRQADRGHDSRLRSSSS